MASEKAPTAPADSAHYAWNAATAARSAELASLGATTAPALIRAGDASPAAGATSPSGGSAWNAAGTWEERDVSAHARALLRERLLALVFPPARGLTLALLSVEVQGDVRLIHVRGKTRAAFELSVTAAWELGGGGGGARAAAGSFTLAAEDTDADLFDALRVTVASVAAASTGEAVAAVKASDAAVRDALRAWVDALKS